MPKVTLSRVNTSDVPFQWSMWAQFIAKAQQRYEKDYGISDVYDALALGKAQLWGIYVDGQPEAAMTTSIQVFPRRKTLLIELVGGSKAKIWASDVIDQLGKAAQAVGVEAIEGRARFGWWPMAKQAGFKRKYAAYELELV